MGYSFKWILEHISQSFQTGSYSLTAGSASYASTASYVTGSIFTSTNPALSASYALSSSNATTASFITASNVYGPYGSSSILSASYALTASYAMNGGGGGGTPGGANTTIQFNSGGFFSGSSNFTFMSSSNSVILTGSMYVSGAISASFGANTVGFYGTSSWAVSASWAPLQNNISGSDQYLARFSGSNGIETGSIYNDRIAKSINSGELNTMSLSYPISHSHIFGYNNHIDVNGFSGRYSTSSLLAGQFNVVFGADTSTTLNKLTSAVGNYDHIQNLYASSAPRVVFSGWEASTKTLYAPISGDVENILSAGRMSIIVVVNKSTNAAFIGYGISYPVGPLPAPNKVSVRDNNFETWGGNRYDGRGIYVSNIKTVNPGFESTNYTNSEIVVFVIDGSTNGYYDTFANHAQNIGTSAHGVGTHAEGYYTQTRGYYTHAQNNESIAAGSGSTASGHKTAASGKSSNANNVFTAAGPSWYIDKTSIFRSSKTYHDYFYDYDTLSIGSGGSGTYDNIITYFNSDKSAQFADSLYAAGYVDHTSALKCIVQVPAVDYIGIVEIFASTIGGIKRPVTFSDILPDTIGRPTTDDLDDYVIIVTALEDGTFMNTYNEKGGGPGYGSFAQGVETISTGTGSFAGGRRVRSYGNTSFGYGQNIEVVHNNTVFIGYAADGNTQSSVANNSFHVAFDSTANLFVTKSFVGVNTTTQPTSFNGLRVANDLLVDQDATITRNLKVTGSTYLGNDTTDRVAITGSLGISGSSTIAPLIITATTTPPAVAGGIYFDGTDFYLGFP